MKLKKMLIASDFSVQPELPCGFVSELKRYVYQTLAISVLTVWGSEHKFSCIWYRQGDRTSYWV
jgi:hypothetical protein